MWNRASVTVMVGMLGVVARGEPLKPDAAPGPVPAGVKLVIDEDWSSGKIDPAKWYALRKQWGRGNNGVVPENVAVVEEPAGGGRKRNVLVCRASGDLYDGPVIGKGGSKARVGGVLVARPFVASGRYEVVMRIGGEAPHDGGPADPRRPIGTIPAVWTYAYAYVAAPRGKADQFLPDRPMYNPLMQRPAGANEYWSELDFPEFGKAGNFDKALYNTFCQTRHRPDTFDVSPAIDGKYHTLTTEWRTELRPIDGVTDAHVIEQGGYWWVADKAITFDRYLGNPLKRLAKDRYAVYAGKEALHWIDGRPVAKNVKYVPAMAAQLNLGVWLPDWAGPAPWKTAEVRFAAIRVWAYGDAGDVAGVLTRDISNSFDEQGKPK